jgi:hypothetical protein
MTSGNSEIAITLAQSEKELREGLAFVRTHYLKAFGVSPSSPDHLLVARMEARVIGTIGINVWSKQNGLRLATLYQFDPRCMMIPFDLRYTVEFARWACESSGVACALLHAATRFSLNRGARSVLCEHSPSVNRVCRKYGIVFYPIKDACLKWDAIEDHHRGFYDSTHAALYVFELEQAQAALKEYLDSHP